MDSGSQSKRARPKISCAPGTSLPHGLPVIVVMLAGIIVFIPVAIRMPPVAVFVPALARMRPAVLPRPVQLLARVRSLPAWPAVVFHSLVPPLHRDEPPAHR